MTFQEAEQQFRALEGQFRAGGLSLDQYRAALSRLQVYDAEGRVWMPQERTGVWHVLINGRWEPGQAPTPVVAPTAPVVPPRSLASGQHLSEESSNHWIGWIIGWLVLWGALAFVVVRWGTRETTPLLVMAGIASLTLLMLVLTLRTHWEGQVIDLRVERRHVRDSDGDWHNETTRYAIVQQPDGSTKRVQAGRRWRTGDYVVKKRGNFGAHKVE